MVSKLVLPRWIATLLAAGGLSAQEAIEVGSDVPPLSGDDVSGRPLSWEDFEDRVVLVFFHSAQMAYSAQGLEVVLEALGKDSDLAARTGILLVGTGKVDAAAIARKFDAARVQGRVVADPDRSRFAPFHVVAFPTVFTVAPDRKVRAVVKGYGPLMAVKVTASARFAAGMIDAAEYQRSLEYRPPAERSAKQLRLARTVRMVKQLMAAGMLDQARDSLLRVMDAETEHAEAAGLLARILLRLGRRDEARPWIERLEQISPGAVEAKRLRAQLALQEQKPDTALELLEKLPEDDPEAALLRGKAWEAKGNPAKAAELYRKALEALLEARGW